MREKQEQRHEGLNQAGWQAAEVGESWGREGEAGGRAADREAARRPRSWWVCWAGKVEELVLEAMGLQALKQRNQETRVVFQ